MIMPYIYFLIILMVECKKFKGRRLYKAVYGVSIVSSIEYHFISLSFFQGYFVQHAYYNILDFVSFTDLFIHFNYYYY